MAADIEAALRRLAHILQRIETEFAWDRLAQREARRDRPPGFRLQTSVRDDAHTDLADLIGEFIVLAVETDHALRQPGLLAPFADRERWARRLRRLEDRFADLTAGKHF